MKRRIIGVIGIIALATLAAAGVFTWRLVQRKNELAAQVERYEELCRFVATLYGMSAADVERNVDKQLVAIQGVQEMTSLPAPILDFCATTPLDDNHERLESCWINKDKACWAREARAIVDHLPARPR